MICGNQFDANHIYQATCSAVCEKLWEVDAAAQLAQSQSELVPKALATLGFSSVEEYEKWVNRARDLNHLGTRVYFLQQRGGDDLIKIGHSSNVEDRRKQLQGASAYLLELLGSMQGTEELEKELHFRFRDAHVRGEWFRPTDALLAHIAGVNESQ